MVKDSPENASIVYKHFAKISNFIEIRECTTSIIETILIGNFISLIYTEEHKRRSLVNASEWFLPFHKNNKLLGQYYSGNKIDEIRDVFIEKLTNAYSISTMEKYLLAFNSLSMSDKVIVELTETFNKEIELINELYDNLQFKRWQFDIRQIISDFLFKIMLIDELKFVFDRIRYNSSHINESIINNLAKLTNQHDINIVYYFGVDKEKALESCVKACKSDPNNYSLWYNQGILLSKPGTYEEAIRCFKKSIKLNPKFSGTYINLANIFKALGQEKTASTYFQKARELNSPFTEKVKDFYNYACK